MLRVSESSIDCTFFFFLFFVEVKGREMGGSQTQKMTYPQDSQRVSPPYLVCVSV